MGTDEFSALDELKRFTDEGVRTHRKVYKRIAETTGMTIEQLSDGIYHANLRADVAQILQREAEALNKELAEVLKGYEQWEADLILSNEAWEGSLPRFTQELCDKWMALQGKRNAALAKAVE